MKAMNLMPSFARLMAGAMLAAVAYVAVPASAQNAPPAAQQQQKPVAPTVMKTFGGWDVRCYPVASPAPCDMWEAIAFKKGGQLAVSVSIIYVPSRDEHMVQFVVPLGVDFAKGAKIVSDTFASSMLPYHHCDRIGCYVIVPRGNNVIDALKTKDDMKVRVGQFRGKLIDLDVPLKGFVDAHTAMVDLARQKATSAAAAPPADSPSP